MLTEKQFAHFRTFGFVILRDLFTQEEVETLNAEFDNACERASSYDPFDGSKRHIFRFRGEDGPFFASLMEDPRFAATAEQLYGEDVFATGCSGGIRFVNKGTKWHPDTVNKNQYGIKFGFYLQPLRADSGALRVIPGSHQNPLHSDLREVRAKQKLGGSHPVKQALGGVENVPSYPCETDPRDVLAFDLRLWHASWGGFEDRKMCEAVFYNYPKSAEEMEATRWQLVMNADQDYSAAPWDDPDRFPGGWHENPDRNPKRERWLDQMREIREAETGLRAEMTGMDSTLVPDSVQTTYRSAQIAEAVDNVPIYREA